MAETYVAVSRLKHGLEDGSVLVFEPGEEVKVGGKDRLPKELVQSHLVEGSITVKGWSDDPGTWESAEGANSRNPASSSLLLDHALRASHGPAVSDELKAVADGHPNDAAPAQVGVQTAEPVRKQGDGESK
jgi:metal-dependent amidase/aminoacylase/carboxypeptidase family protein